MRRGRSDAAIAQYEKAERIQPSYFEAHNNFGGALGRAGRVPEAIAQYKKALELAPDSATALQQPGSGARPQRPIERGDDLFSEGN